MLDWGLPGGLLPRAGFPLLRAIDGPANTAPLARGELQQMIDRAGFTATRRLHRIGTVWGTLEQFSAERA